MRRAIAALIVTIVVVVLLTGFHARTPALRAALPAAKSSGATTSKAASGTGTAGTSTGSSSKAHKTHKAASSAQPKAPTTRTAVGDPIQFRYGVVQVQATVRAGQLTAVQTTSLQADGGRSQSIDQQAEPLLRQEALQAHSANIDIVSGATYTSQAYAQSLQSAIDRARSA
jgi:uncharacterized protein with FMN-binding domain